MSCGDREVALGSFDREVALGSLRHLSPMIGKRIEFLVGTSPTS